MGKLSVKELEGGKGVIGNKYRVCNLFVAVPVSQPPFITQRRVQRPAERYLIISDGLHSQSYPHFTPTE